MAQKERENFYRNATVIVDHGKESLSAVLDNDLSNTNMTFEDFINTHQHDIYHLCYNKFPCCQCSGGRFGPANQSRILIPDQLDILLDKSGSTLNGHSPNTSRMFQHCCRPAKPSLSYTDLDITLLRCLLINFAQNCQTNSTLRHDIEDLVKCRNKLYGHAQEARLTDADYRKYKSDVEGIILRIARFCNIENDMKQKLNDVSQRPLDETILIQYQNTLMQQSLYDRNIEEKVDKLQHYLTAQDKRLDCRMGIIESKVSEVGHRKRNIIVQTEAQLLEHSEDDTYVITEDVELCCQILEKYNALVIMSKAGGGKSKTCLQIAIKYQAKLYTSMLFVNDEITRNRDLINFDDNNIVIVEDLFGRSNVEFNEDLHRGILDVLYSCIKTESCKSKLIITIRGNEEINRKFIGKHGIFEKDILINLDKIRSRQSKKIILSKHMKEHDIRLCNCGGRIIGETLNHPEIIKRCSSTVVETSNNSMQLCVLLIKNICDGKYEMQIGFPQACHLFCSNKNLTKQGMTYFTHTSQSLVDEMDKLKIEGFDKKLAQYQYCILVYTAMKTVFAYDDFDENCFHEILSSVYDEHINIKRSLLKAAVLVLEGTYISQKTAIWNRELLKRPKESVHYVLQHNTIQEAVIISYGDNADVSTFCDFSFLLEYIRPKGYIDHLSNSMVILYTDYELLVKRLKSELLINDNSCTFVGMYLQVVALLHRRNEIIQFFFEHIKDVKPEQYTCLVNGLTSFGKNADFVVFHPKLFKDLMIHFSVKVFLEFCRPIEWADTTESLVQMETDMMIEKLYLMVALGKPNANELKPKKNENKCHSIYSLFPFPEKTNEHYALGNYVFQNLIDKGFLSIVNSLLTKLKQNEKTIGPINIMDFLDGLLNYGKRSSIVSQFKDFFDTILFKYGSIPTILQLCRPLTATLSQNIIQVDDRLLIGKLCAYLEDISRVTSYLHTAVPRENDTYFVYLDFNYIHGFYINDIAKFIFEHGVKLYNDKFVRTMYDQLVSDKEQTSDGEESVNDFESTSDDGKNRDECEENAIPNSQKIIFDDYPDDEITVNENGKIVQIKVDVGFVKRVYIENSLSIHTIPLDRLLVDFLCPFNALTEKWLFSGNSTCKRMAILHSKFEKLLEAMMHT